MTGNYFNSYGGNTTTVHSSCCPPFKTSKPIDMDLDFDLHNLDSVLVNDPWAAPPLAPGIWDLDLSPQKVDIEEPKLITVSPLSMSGLATPPQTFTATPSPMAPLPLALPPAPRPARLSLTPCDAACSPPANASFDDEDSFRGRSPGPAGFIPPPTPRLESKELPGANPGPAPQLTGTRPRFSRGYSALGLDLTSVQRDSTSPSSRDKRRRSSWEASPTLPSPAPYQRRGRSDDFHDRVSSWSGAVAAATSHTTPVHAASSRSWADDLGFVISPHMHHSASSGSNVSSQRTNHADQLDPWAARIGRSRGRTVDMPVANRSRVNPASR